MKHRKNTLTKSIVSVFLSVLMVLGVAAPTQVMASPRFKDVPTSHWAHEHVQRVASLGLIVGNLEGNYKPEEYIDKFDTSIILARILGFKGTDGTAAEQTRYAQIYENWENVIEANTKKFTKWKKYANESIAFLLEYGVLTERDLYQFIVTVNGNERLRALNREEMAIFLVRTLKKVGESEGAESRVSHFKDHGEISNSAVPYVYYLKETKIVEGDLENRYNPQSAVKRAEMAKVVDITYQRLDPDAPAIDDGEDTNRPETEKTDIKGTIVSLYNRDANAIRYKADGSDREVTKLLTPTVSIRVDDVLSRYDDLKVGMQFTATQIGSDGDIDSISAKSGGTTKPDVPKEDEKPSDKDKLIKLDGIVEYITASDGENYIEIESHSFDKDGEIKKDFKKLRVANGAKITKDGKDSHFIAITEGDVVIVEYENDVIYNLRIENDRREFEGTLVEKIRHKKNTILVIKDKDKYEAEYEVTKNTRLHREGRNNVTVSDLRVGDTVEVIADYREITNLYAKGHKTDTDVVVETIYSSHDEAYIIGKDSYGDSKKYPIILSSVDNFGQIKVGSKIRIFLDSDEVSSIRILEEYTEETATGEVTDVSRNFIEVKDFKTGNKVEFRIDENTKATNMITGKSVSPYYVDIGMDVYIITRSNSRVADTIRILNDGK